jgi:alginate O-acetyltransferase complex protein AlgI
MLFNSYAFLLGFLPAAIVISRIADPYPAIRTRALIVLSLGFYSYWDPRFLPLLIGSIVVNWLVANYFATSKNSGVIIAAIIGNLALLAFFKYGNFLSENFTFLTGVPVGRLDLVLPLGISFFTFHHIMYLVDLRRGLAPLYPLDRYALYICFFPQSIAGPLARWSEVVHQFGRKIITPGWEHRCSFGIALIVIGLVEKVMLGDSVGRLVDPIYAQAKLGPVVDGSAWFAIAFGFQVFFDFAGYSDIAIGLGLIFGIELPRNFNAPFRATSIQDLWQRWHMTLMLFLRNYVFFSLSNIRLARGKYRVVQQFAAIVLTMALCGLWHGASWTFVLWGTLNGCAIVLVALWPRYLPSPPSLVGWAATVSFFLLSGVLFRAGTLQTALNVYQGLATVPSLDRLIGADSFGLAAACAILLPASHAIALRLTKQPRPIIAIALALVGVAILLEIGSQESYEFIYFQF